MGWTPANIDTVLWVDASDTGTLTLDGSSKVSQWSDKSGNANHITQTEAANRPTVTDTLNSVNIPTFDAASSQYLDWPGSVIVNTDYHIAVVFVRKETTGYLFYTPSTGFYYQSFQFGYLTSSYLRMTHNSIPACNITDAETTAPLTLIANLSFAAAAGMSVHLDGLGVSDCADIDHDLDANANATIAGGSYFDCAVAEIVIIDSAASDDTRQKLEGYLAHKWALTDSLAASHPYKTNAPGELLLESGAYAVTGSDIAFQLGNEYAMVLEPGTYAVAGSDVSLKMSMTLSSGAYDVTGADMGFSLATSETSRPGTVVYLFTLTGSADGEADVEIPVKSIQARMRSGSPTYLSVSLPKLTAYEGYITDRPNGTMQIDVAYLLDGEYTLRETIISVSLVDIRVDKGPFSKSITLTGRQQKTYSNKSITLYRPIYKSITNGQVRYRFAEPHVYLFPGDTVTIGSDVITANLISYVVTARTGGMETSMEISEGSY